MKRHEELFNILKKSGERKRKNDGRKGHCSVCSRAGLSNTITIERRREWKQMGDTYTNTLDEVNDVEKKISNEISSAFGGKEGEVLELVERPNNKERGPGRSGQGCGKFL